jgi:hypothetical protein
MSDGSVEWGVSEGECFWRPSRLVLAIGVDGANDGKCSGWRTL